MTVCGATPYARAAPERTFDQHHLPSLTVPRIAQQILADQDVRVGKTSPVKAALTRSLHTDEYDEFHPT